MNSSIHYASSNPLVTAEDIKDHIGVGAVVHHHENHNLILVFFHKKYQFWTIPVGKCAHGDMHTIKLGLRIELKEEINIDSVGLTTLGMFAKTYDRGQGIKTYIESYLFDVYEYAGIPTNAEPHKHSNMEWKSIEELETHNPIDLSDMTRFYIYLQKGILNIPSVQLIK